MSELLTEILARMHRDDHPLCPHCKGEIDMTDSERLMGHVSYWGEDEPVAEACPHCNVEVYLKERVSRSWSVGRTPAEANEL